MTKEKLKGMTKNDVIQFIRKSLIIEKNKVPFKICMKDNRPPANRLRFDMSGYESNTGDNTIHNQGILNIFAYLGIYDYTEFLFIDFYKGAGRIFLSYFYSPELQEVNVCGSSTSEIIYEIFLLTIFSDLRTRRRN